MFHVCIYLHLNACIIVYEHVSIQNVYVITSRNSVSLKPFEHDKIISHLIKCTLRHLSEFEDAFVFLTS